MVRRLGGKREIPVDIRIVAATNKDLQKAIGEGELREDLFYRLAVVEIDLPPLRERGGDVTLLAQEFLSRFAKANGKKLDGFDDAACEWINSYSWPGNVRELRNAVEKAVIMARGPRVTVDDLASRRHRATGEYAAVVSVPIGTSLADTRRQLVLKTFANNNGDLPTTAKTVGISVGEVRAELQALLERRGTESRSGSSDDRTVDERTSEDLMFGDRTSGDRTSADRAAESSEGAPRPATNGSAAPLALPARDGATRAEEAGDLPPVVLPENMPSPVGKTSKTPAAARGRRGG